MADPSLDQLRRSFRRATERRTPWEQLWRDCYAYALPLRGFGLGSEFAAASRFAERLFDSTAADAVEQLAASLLAELTPPWSRWFGLRPGQNVPAEHEGAFAEELDRVANRIQGHFDRSGFAVEIHQCFLDLATVGTATLMFREAPAGEASAFRFTAVPAAEMFIDGEAGGPARRVFRMTAMTAGTIRATFPAAALPADMLDEAADRRVNVVEAVWPVSDGYGYRAFLAEAEGAEAEIPLAAGRFEQSPFITFRWLKGAGEIYGRSPVMTALPDIKTANKVVELVLKNASIAVTGIWLADDDGVLNPANIKLTPGSIIPKAPGSAGLTPLAAPGRFDVSELVLSDLRARIRHTLLVDRLAPIDGPRMTATEVAERSAQTGRLLGAVYGRLQSELLNPLLGRAVAILRRRGEIPDLALDGRMAELQWRSPLARAQARDDVSNTLLWLEQVGRLGPEAKSVIDPMAAARWLARMLGVPGELVREDVGIADGLLQLLSLEADNAR
jgi:hypothetical protein